MKSTRIRSRREAADFLGISLRTLARLEAKGLIGPRIKVSDRLYGYSDEALDDFIKSRTEAA